MPGVPVERILALGAEDYDGGDPGVFNMAVMGFRLAQRANGVSQLHGEVSRGMFAGLWPAFDEAEVADRLDHQRRARADLGGARDLRARRRARRRRRRPTTPTRSGRRRQGARRGPLGDQAGAARAARRGRPQRLRESWTQRGAAPAELGWIDSALDPDVLTIGFARRVPSYKRLTLMLRDPERLKRLLLHPERPVQLVIAGKAHPADEGGKKLIQEIVRFADDPEVRHRIVFLPNYDIAMAQPLYPGCDVWLNNPLRPYEACGTSGMKAALNGGLNLSILDGWWDEWYDGDNGWAIPSADGVDDPDRRDDIEASALYDLIENEVAPRFYDVDDDGVPTRWIEMVRHTLKSLGPKVLADPDGPRLRRARSTRPAAVTSRALNGDYDGRRRRSPTGSSGSAPAGPASASTTSSPSGCRRRPGDRRRLDRPRLRLARRARRPTTSTSRSCTAGSTTRTSCVDTTTVDRSSSARPTRAAGTASRATSRLDRPARSATPSGSLPAATTILASPAELGARRPARLTRLGSRLTPSSTAPWLGRSTEAPSGLEGEDVAGGDQLGLDRVARGRC